MYPKPPSHINHVTRRRYIDGSPMCYRILGEIIHVPRSNRAKALYLQLLQFDDDGREEMRLCYYMIGQRGRTKGKWVYAQFAPMIRREDFEQLIKGARRKRWIRR